jgi:ADP-ribose pyrophosphatase YjhB (NUDIX family)
VEISVIKFEIDGIRFNYRVAGAAFHEGHVLLQQADGSDFWFLPGGRCEIGEPSAGALAREMVEEIDEVVTVDRLVWVAENFFEEAGVQFHELGLYYLMRFLPGAPILDLSRCFPVLEGSLPFTFRWFPLEALAQLRVYPDFLPNGLAHVPDHITHVIHHDAQEG